MQRFLTLDATKQTVDFIEATNYRKALEKIGLSSGSVDYQTIPEVEMVLWVYELGLFSNPDKIPFLSLHGQLFSGNMLFTGYTDSDGEDRDCTVDDKKWIESDLQFFKNGAEIEQAIAAGKLRRPERSMTFWDDRKATYVKEILWEWRYPQQM